MEFEDGFEYYDPYDAIPFGDAQRWEDDRVFEDMAIERAEAEAEAEAEREAEDRAAQDALRVEGMVERARKQRQAGVR